MLDVNMGIYFISLRVRKCGFTHVSRAEIRIFTPRDIKFRTILVLQTHTRQKTFHRTRIVMYYYSDDNGYGSFHGRFTTQKLFHMKHFFKCFLSNLNRYVFFYFAVI